MGYRIERDVSGFILYHNDQVLCRFLRDSFRNDLELYAKTNNLSSQWIGYILRLFLKKFPPPPPLRVSALERFRMYFTLVIFASVHIHILIYTAALVAVSSSLFCIFPFEDIETFLYLRKFHIEVF